MRRNIEHAIIFLLFLATGCGASVEQPSDVPPSEVIQEQTPTIEPTSSPIPTQYIVEPDSITNNPIFCEKEEKESQFALACTEDELIISQRDNRRGKDIMLTREQSVETWGFEVNATLVSYPAYTRELDRNEFGFFFRTENEKTYAVRLQGQYINFEEWKVENDERKFYPLNQAYTPTLDFAEEINEIRLVCTPENCDFFANEILAGRFLISEPAEFESIGLFAASVWYERFGAITLQDLSIESLAATRPEAQPFVLIDDLSEDHGTFSKMGLSGAFSDYEEDGFHFSPVIPYGYYAAKGGPSLSDVSVLTTINMDFTPGISTSQYGGVVCRSSFDGMYIAVIRADATYTIFRDTRSNPFAMLAEGDLPKIQAGRSENTMQLDCIRNNLSLTINGTLVESFEDTRSSLEFGRNGLYTKAGKAPTSDAIIFRDFAIKEIR